MIPTKFDIMVFTLEEFNKAVRELPPGSVIFFNEME